MLSKGTQQLSSADLRRARACDRDRLGGARRFGRLGTLGRLDRSSGQFRRPSLRYLGHLAALDSFAISFDRFGRAFATATAAVDWHWYRQNTDWHWYRHTDWHWYRHTDWHGYRHRDGHGCSCHWHWNRNGCSCHWHWNWNGCSCHWHWHWNGCCHWHWHWNGCCQVRALAVSSPEV